MSRRTSLLQVESVQFSIFSKIPIRKSPQFSFLSFAFYDDLQRESFSWTSRGLHEFAFELKDALQSLTVNALVMPYYKAVPILSLTSVRKVTIFWIPSNHDLTRLRVERQPRLFKVVTQCSLSQSDRLSAVTNR